MGTVAGELMVAASRFVQPVVVAGTVVIAEHIDLVVVAKIGHSAGSMFEVQPFPVAQCFDYLPELRQHELYCHC